MPQRYLFVCLGNICRSPVAEGVMLHLAQIHNLDLEIDSAGTSAYHSGDPPDPRSVASTLKNGIDIRGLRARQFELSDFDRFDRIYVMDRSNLNFIKSLSLLSTHMEKIRLLPHPTEEEVGIEIPDPYYGEEKDFELVFDMVYKSCEKLCKALKNS